MRGDRVHIYNPMTETHWVRDFAKLASDKMRGSIDNVPNPRSPDDEDPLPVVIVF